jgi:hypothetical protein
MPTILQLFPNLSPAAATPLRGSTRIYLNEQTTGTLSLVRQLLKETGPPGVMDGLREHTARQALDIQVLDRNHPEAANETVCQLMLEVEPLVLDPGVRPLEDGDGLLSALAPLLAASDPTLCDAEGGLGVLVMPGVINHGAVTQNGETFQSHIDTDGSSARNERLGFDLHAEAGIPFSRLALHGDHLGHALKGPVHLDLDAANALNAQLSILLQPAPVAVCEVDTVEALMGLEARETGSLAGLDAPKECLERFIEPSKHLLAAGKVSESGEPLGANFLELVRLVLKANRLLGKLPRVSPLLKRGIVHGAGFAKLLGQAVGLAFGWIQSVSKGLTHHCIILQIKTNVLLPCRISGSCRTAIPLSAKARQSPHRLLMELPRVLDLGFAHLFNGGHIVIRWHSRTRPIVSG